MAQVFAETYPLSVDRLRTVFAVGFEVGDGDETVLGPAVVGGSSVFPVGVEMVITRY